jgi:outer membrane protein assembly factor BamB
MLAATSMAASAVADDWPQWMGPKRDGVWREDGILTKFPAGGLKRLWSTPIGGGFSGPAVADGRVFVMDRQGEKLPKGKEAPMKGGLPGKERVLCLDAADGKILWKHEYDCSYRVLYTSGPRTTPTVHGGKVYTLGSMGDLFCFDAAKGTIHWSKNLPQEYETKPPVWGYAGHLLVDGDRVITSSAAKAVPSSRRASSRRPATGRASGRPRAEESLRDVRLDLRSLSRRGTR